MKFRTEIKLAQFPNKIEYGESILAIGSCFATSISERLSEAKFRVVANPTGVLFNPLSIASAARRFGASELVESSQLRCHNGLWYHPNFHSSFSALAQDEALAGMNDAISRGHEALAQSSWVLLTFGTAWVYRSVESGEVVANCHKLPASNFTRELLTIEQIVECYDRLLSNELKGRRVILTLSPIRHILDGLEQNSLSKALLRVAIAQLVERHENLYYFPSYEILMDDLRDYRFYGEDMLHPSQQAVSYIFEKFVDAVLSASAQSTMAQVMQIVRAVNHRPFSAHSDEYRRFCRAQLAKIEQIKSVNLDNESAYFRGYLQNNL